jgi:hypothetical protein
MNQLWGGQTKPAPRNRAGPDQGHPPKALVSAAVPPDLQSALNEMETERPISVKPPRSGVLEISMTRSEVLQLAQWLTVLQLNFGKQDCRFD